MDIEIDYLHQNKEAAEKDEAVDKIGKWDKLTDKEIDMLLSDDDSKEVCQLLWDYHCARFRKNSPTPDVAKVWKIFYDTNLAPRRLRSLYRKRLLFVAATAAAVVALVWGVYSYFQARPADDHLMAFVAEDRPQKVLLGKAEEQMKEIELAYHDEGTVINSEHADFSHPSANAAGLRMLSTPRGKAYKLILSDGTRVMLNAESQLIFPVHFSGDIRQVKLKGEAYFKVKKNAKHPFIVETDRLLTRVLGTEFNLKAYPGAENHVTLVSGSVAIRNKANSREVVLKPGEDAFLSENERFNVTCIDTEYYVQWKDGYFYFDNLPLVDILKEIGRWYNVSIEICDNSLMSYRLHFIADRNAGISHVVKNLNAFSYLKAELKGNKIILSSKKEEN